MDPRDFPYEQFSKFKAEKEQNLLAFHQASQPGEVPVVVRVPNNASGKVCRYREQSLAVQLDAMALSMQVKSDFLYTSYLEPWHGVGVYANIFGSPVNWSDYDAPQTHYLYHALEEVENLKRPDIMAAELPQMVMETMRYFRKMTGDRLDICLTDTQSPNDSASLILDTTAFFTASLAETERLEPFMHLLTDVMIEFSEMQFEALGPTASHPGHGFLSAPGLRGIAVSDDNMAVISKPSYRNTALPYNNRLGEHFGCVSIHTCGNFKQNYEIVKQVKNLQLVDCAVSGADPDPNNAGKLAAAFAGSGIALKVRIGGPEHWHVLDELVRPDLKLMLQISHEGDVAQTNATYEALKARVRSLLH